LEFYPYSSNLKDGGEGGFTSSNKGGGLNGFTHWRDFLGEGVLVGTNFWVWVEILGEGLTPSLGRGDFPF